MQAATSNWTHTASDVSFETQLPGTMSSRQPEDDAQEGATPVTMHHANVARIIPSLPLETRWPAFRLRHYAGFWVPEVKTLKIGIPAIHSCFKPRPTDVFLASYPKSGTTWLKALAFATLKRSTHPPCYEDHPLRHCGPHYCARFLETHLNKGDEFDALPSPRVLATHLPYSLLPSSITGERSGCRIVCICREPKDALVSYWLFIRKAALAWEVDVQSFTIEEAFELFCEGHCPDGPQWQHVL
jgi:hypothetical protein